MFAKQMFPELRTGLRQGEGGKGVWRCVCLCVCVCLLIIYLSLHCHHQNKFCIRMGSDESHFNVS